MEKKFNVVCTGLNDGVSSEEFVKRFCDKFGVSEEKAEKIVNSSKDVVIKKDLDEGKAKKYAQALESCGLVVRLDAIVTSPSGLSLEPMEKGNTEEEKAEVEENNSELAHDGPPSSPVISSAPVPPPPKKSASTDPYATPEAQLEREYESDMEGQGSIESALAGEYDIQLGDVFSEAWSRTSGYKGAFLTAWFFYVLASIGMNGVNALATGVGGEYLGLLVSLISIPVMYPILAGITLLGILHSVDIPFQATSVYSHYSKALPITLVTIVSGLLTIIGLVLLIIPGIYIAIAYMMATALVIDRDMPFWEAMETSRKAVTQHWFQLFIIYFVLGIILMISMMPMFIGLIWALPFATIVHGIVYKQMFGVVSKG